MEASRDKEIIELRPEKPDEGEIRYTYSASSAPSRSSQNLLKKIFGFFVGVGLLVLFVLFFVYVILPVVAVLLIWMLVRNLIKSK